MMFPNRHPASDCVVLKLTTDELLLTRSEIRDKLSELQLNEYIILSPHPTGFRAEAVIAKEVDFMTIEKHSLEFEVDSTRIIAD